MLTIQNISTGQCNVVMIGWGKGRGGGEGRQRRRKRKPFYPQCHLILMEMTIIKHISHIFCRQYFSTPASLREDILSPILATIVKGSGFKSHFSCNPTFSKIWPSLSLGYLNHNVRSALTLFLLPFLMFPKYWRVSGMEVVLNESPNCRIHKGLKMTSTWC